jgi:multicomponent Na+:H+ antiporter subunit F
MSLPLPSFGAFFLGAAVFVLLTLLLSLLRVFRGPTPVDRILAAQLMGTTGVAVQLLLGTGLKLAGTPIDGVVDVALVFAILAGVAGVAFVHRGWEGAREEEAMADDDDS